MNFLLAVVFLPALAETLPFSFPKNTFHRVLNEKRDFESSGAGPEETGQGVVKVVKLDPRLLAQSGLSRRGLVPRTAPGLRLPFPAFLASGRPGPVLPAKLAVPPRTQAHHESHAELDLKKKQGQRMWQKAVDKGDHGKMHLPVNLKEAGKQTCTAVPYTHRVTEEGCNTVTVHNKLCFGQCSSLFVPSGGEFASLSSSGQRLRPCSRCAPSKATRVTVPLRCGAEWREKRVLVVEECKCETGREEGNIEAHL